MSNRKPLLLILSLFLSIQLSPGQISSFPYSENFDGVTVPALPAGWSTSILRQASGDFTSTTSSPRSAPNALISTNSTITQTLTSHQFDFRGKTLDKLLFYSSRSSTHVAGLLVEASLDGGTTFPIALSDTIKNPGVTTFVLTTLALPASLNNQPNVRIRWRLVAGSSGTSGTFRIDDVSLTIQTQYDLAITKLTATPLFPTVLESVQLTATVKNLSVLSVSGYSVDFFRDTNSNGVADVDEKFASGGGSTLGPNDSVSVNVTHPPLPSGDHRFIARLVFAQDENRMNDSAVVIVSVGIGRGAVVVNEIMYAPTGDEPEWVELYNTTTDTLNLKNWRISDSNIGTKTVISASDIFISPGSYLLVAKDAIISTIHPSISIPVAIANFSTLNNTTPDAVVIYDSRLATIDSLMYDPKWGGSGGKSLERIDYAALSTLASNWITSEDSLGRTPGRVNSRARLTHDLSIRRVSQVKVQSGSATVPKITAVVSNDGRFSAQSYTLKFYADLNRNGIGDLQEIIHTFNAQTQLFPLDSLSIEYLYQNAPAGETEVLAVLEYSLDQRLRNNSSIIKVQNRFEERTLVVNEIMFDPLKEENEWIELYHRGTLPVDLFRWKITDRPTSSGSVSTFIISNQSKVIQPGEFVLVAAESTIYSRFPNLRGTGSGYHVIILNRTGGMSLSNDGDDIILRDNTDSVIDSVSYTPKWHHPDLADTKGRSLERINPHINSNDRRNWSTTANIDGGTPGFPNSILALSVPTAASLSISPNPFSPDGDGYEDFCIIKYTLPMTTSLVRIRIYDLRGRMIRMLANSEPSGATGEIVWDGLDDERQKARIGPHIILIDAIDNEGGVVEGAKGVVVVATRL